MVTCVNDSTMSESDESLDSSDEEIDVYHADQFSTEELSLEVPEALVRPGIVHRLDKGTSGLLVVAKVSSYCHVDNG